MNDPTVKKAVNRMATYFSALLDQIDLPTHEAMLMHVVDLRESDAILDMIPATHNASQSESRSM